MGARPPRRPYRAGGGREAFTQGLPFIDLCPLCASAEGYANVIEPSVQGGAKVVQAIVGLVVAHDVVRRRPEVFTGGPQVL